MKRLQLFQDFFSPRLVPLYHTPTRQQIADFRFHDRRAFLFDGDDDSSFLLLLLAVDVVELINKAHENTKRTISTPESLRLVG